jgi:hypothetical protein
MEVPVRAWLLGLFPFPLIFPLAHCSSSHQAGPPADGGNDATSVPDASLDSDAGLATNGWNWNGIVGTGQSLAVGTTPITSTTQPYNNLKLSLGGATVPPWEPANDAFSMVPLVEPIRTGQSGYPAPYPGNIWGETPHSAMANQITFLVKSASPDGDYVTVHTVVGESGQGITVLKKQTGDTTGTTGRAYAATLFEAAAITRLAQAAGKTYGIGGIVMTHGETDSGSSTYQAELIQLLSDYNADLAAINGDSVEVTAGADLPASGLMVGYAMSSQGVQMKTASLGVRWGQLRDSDPFVGSTSGQPHPNYCVSFELPVP